MVIMINKALEIKIPFLAVFRNLSVIFPVMLYNYWENLKITSLKYHLDSICYDIKYYMLKSKHCFW